MGAGAVGCYFGGMLARAGAPVTLIGRAAHADAISRDGLFIDSIHFQERVAVAAAADVAAARGAEVVLFCVKTPDTETAAAELAPHLAAGAIVVSLQNGVDNAERIRRATNIPALPAVVYVAAAMTAPGRVTHRGRGDLVIGVPRDSHEPAREKERVARVAELFTCAGVPCRVTGNIEGELWAKLVVNCAGNAVSALGRSSYARAAAHEAARKVMAATAEEATAVARAAGITLPDGDLVAAGLQLAAQLGEATSSTEQDIRRGRHTEIESLNGFVARRGAELGVATPVNFTFYALVRLLEEGL
jgi:2-dehydropantoate 2-reductase